VTDADCVAFLQWAHPRLGMRWHGFKKVRRQVCRRVHRRLAELGISDVAAYRAYLEATTDEWSRLDDLCHITISRFYRDRGVFDFLRRVGLPTLARDAKARKTVLEAWSAGSASGEEAYTLALIWHLALAPHLPGVSFHVLATDVDETMLRRARAAEYPGSSLRDLPPAWKDAAFDEHAGIYRLRRDVRDVVEVRRHDLRQASPGGLFDLVLCRNTAFTYFDLDLQREVAARLAWSLRQGGALVLGAHERLPEGMRGFVPWSEALGVYRRSGSATAAQSL
jgi:chemotaxis protein methyltransferase CheR